MFQHGVRHLQVTFLISDFTFFKPSNKQGRVSPWDSSCICSLYLEWRFIFKGQWNTRSQFAHAVSLSNNDWGDLLLPGVKFLIIYIHQYIISVTKWNQLWQYLQTAYKNIIFKVQSLFRLEDKKYMWQMDHVHIISWS